MRGARSEGAARRGALKRDGKAARPPPETTSMRPMQMLLNSALRSEAAIPSRLVTRARSALLQSIRARLKQWCNKIAPYETAASLTALLVSRKRGQRFIERWIVAKKKPVKRKD